MTFTNTVLHKKDVPQLSDSLLTINTFLLRLNYNKWFAEIKLIFIVAEKQF